MIDNDTMESKIEKYTGNHEFLEFLSSEFDKTAVNATVEEMAGFAFGSVDDAIEAFEESKE